MAWNPRRPDIQPIEKPLTLHDLFVTIEKRIFELESAGVPASTDSEALLLQYHRDRVIRIAAEIKLPLGFCKNPGCGLPYIRIPIHKEFCDQPCKTAYHNNHRD